MQLEGAFELAAGRPVQMLPGQGKTLMFMSHALNQAVTKGSVLLVTTTDGLAHREVAEYRRVLEPYGIDVLRADQETGFGQVTPGRPAIVVATGETVGHLSNAGHTPPRSVMIDEMDAVVDRGEKTFIRSDTGSEAAPETTAREVFDAHDFLADALSKGQLSHEDFGLRRIAEEVDVTRPDGTLQIRTEHWYDGQAALTPGGRERVEALPGGQRWLQKMGLSRLETAAAAEFTTRNKTHYVIDEGKVVIIDQVEHGLQRNPKTSSETRWSAEEGKASLAQAVEAKEIRNAETAGTGAEQHQIVVRADTESTTSITAAEIYGTDRFFDQVTGASGTLADLGGVLQTVYGLDTPHEVAPYNPSRLVEGMPDVHENTRAKLNALAGYAHDMWNGGNGRFQEILCHRNDLVEKQVNALLRAGVPRDAIEAVDANRIAEWGAAWETQLQNVFDAAGDQGKILVVNRQGQRGVDIAVSDAVLAQGGMHVWMTEVPEQSYIYDQAKNRTARNGQPGTAQALMSPQDTLIHDAMHLRGVREAVVYYERAATDHHANPTPETHNTLVEAGGTLGSLVPGLQERAHHRTTADFLFRYAPVTEPSALITAMTPWNPDEAELGGPDHPADRTTRLAGLLGVSPATLAAAAAAPEHSGIHTTDTHDHSGPTNVRTDESHTAGTRDTDTRTAGNRTDESPTPLHELLRRTHLPATAVEALQQQLDSTAPGEAVRYALSTDEQALAQLTPRRDRLATELGWGIATIDGAEGLRHLGAATTAAQHELAQALKAASEPGTDPDHDLEPASDSSFPASDITPARARDILGEALVGVLPEGTNNQHPGTDTDPATFDPASQNVLATNVVDAAARYLATAALLDLVTEIHRRSPNSCVNNGVTAMRALFPGNADRFTMPDGGIPLMGHDWNTVRSSFRNGSPKASASLDAAVESLRQRPGGAQVLVYKWKNTESQGSTDADNHLVLLVNDSTDRDRPNLVAVDLSASQDGNYDHDFGPKDLADRRALLNRAVPFDTWHSEQQQFIQKLPQTERAFWTIDFDNTGDLVPDLGPRDEAIDEQPEVSVDLEHNTEEAPARALVDEDGTPELPDLSSPPTHTVGPPNILRRAEPLRTGSRPRGDTDAALSESTRVGNRRTDGVDPTSEHEQTPPTFGLPPPSATTTANGLGNSVGSRPSDEGAERGRVPSTPAQDSSPNDAPRASWTDGEGSDRTEPGWRVWRLRDEVELARVLYHRPEIRQATVATLDRLREVLVALHPGASDAQIDSAFYAPENVAAGPMVPRSVPLDELRRDGNLRELMAAISNAILRSGELPAEYRSTTTLDDGIATLLNRPDWTEEAERLGLDVDALRQVRETVTGGDPDEVVGKRNIRDVRNTVRYREDLEIADERTQSSLAEMERDPRQQVRRGLTVQDWKLLGMPLSPRELAAIPGDLVALRKSVLELGGRELPRNTQGRVDEDALESELADQDENVRFVLPLYEYDENGRRMRDEAGNAVVSKVLVYREERVVDAETASDLDPNEYAVPLPFGPGAARVDIARDSEWFRAVAVEQGFPLLAGLSGTAGRFAARFKWLQPDDVSEVDFAAAILAFLSPQHHSLYEQVRGMQMSGLRLVDEAVLRSPDGAVSELYRAVFDRFDIPAPTGSARVAPIGNRPDDSENAGIRRAAADTETGPSASIGSRPSTREVAATIGGLPQRAGPADPDTVADSRLPPGSIGSRPGDTSRPGSQTATGPDFTTLVLAGRESGIADRTLVEVAPGVRVESVTFHNGTRAFAETYADPVAALEQVLEREVAAIMDAPVGRACLIPDDDTVYREVTPGRPGNSLPTVDRAILGSRSARRLGLFDAVTGTDRATHQWSVSTDGGVHGGRAPSTPDVAPVGAFTGTFIRPADGGPMWQDHSMTRPELAAIRERVAHLQQWIRTLPVPGEYKPPLFQLHARYMDALAEVESHAARTPAEMLSRAGLDAEAQAKARLVEAFTLDHPHISVVGFDHPDVSAHVVEEIVHALSEMLNRFPDRTNIRGLWIDYLGEESASAASFTQRDSESTFRTLGIQFSLGVASRPAWAVERGIEMRERGFNPIGDRPFHHDAVHEFVHAIDATEVLSPALPHMLDETWSRLHESGLITEPKQTWLARLPMYAFTSTTKRQLREYEALAVGFAESDIHGVPIGTPQWAIHEYVTAGRRPQITPDLDIDLPPVQAAEPETREHGRPPDHIGSRPSESGEQNARGPATQAVQHHPPVPGPEEGESLHDWAARIGPVAGLPDTSTPLDDQYIQDWLTEHDEQVKGWRRHIHHHPEASGNEYGTARYVFEVLREAGLDPRLVLDDRGVICDFGPDDGERIVLRADMDALKLDVDGEEEIIHACGHDAHTAMVLAAGQALASNPDRLAELGVGVRLVFQPAEETAEGAREMVQAGLLGGTDRAFALHCDPRLKAGEFGVVVGPMNASADTLTVDFAGEPTEYSAMDASADRLAVDFKGPGGHTAHPEETADLIRAMSEFTATLNTLLTGHIDADGAIETAFGQFRAGDRMNAIPDSGRVEGTVRRAAVKYPIVHKFLHQRLSELKERFDGLTYTLDHERDVDHEGPGGHAGRPEGTVDLIRAISEFTQDLDDSLTEQFGQDGTIVTVFGKADVAYENDANLGTGTISGTIRRAAVDKPDVEEFLEQRLTELKEQFPGLNTDLHHNELVPTVTNDPESILLFLKAIASLGPQAAAAIQMSMGGDDFAHFLNHTPKNGAYLNVGIWSGEGDKYSLHQPPLGLDERALDERALAYGARALAGTVLAAGSVAAPFTSAQAAGDRGDSPETGWQQDEGGRIGSRPTPWESWRDEGTHGPDDAAPKAPSAEARRFGSDAEARVFGERHSPDSSDHRRLADLYITEGTAINRYLRRDPNWHRSTLKIRTADAMDRLVAEIDALMRPLPEVVWITRKLDPVALPALEGLEEGDIWPQPGYLSGATGPEPPAFLAHLPGTLHLLIPRGTPAWFVTNGGDPEIVVGRGHDVLVRRARPDDDSLHVTGDVLPPPTAGDHGDAGTVRPPLAPGDTSDRIGARPRDWDDPEATQNSEAPARGGPARIVGTVGARPEPNRVPDPTELAERLRPAASDERGWRQRRVQDEVELARELYHRPESRQAALAMLDHLHAVLTVLHPHATPEQIDNAFYAPENTTASGMVSRSVSLDELRQHGNLRELMSAVLNAMIRSRELRQPSGTTLDEGLARLLNQQDWVTQAERFGLNVDALSQVREAIVGDDPTREIRARDIRDERNAVSDPENIPIAQELTLSYADRKNRAGPDQERRSLTVQDWNVLGMPLSLRELEAIPGGLVALRKSRLDLDRPLPREGRGRVDVTVLEAQLRAEDDTIRYVLPLYQYEQNSRRVLDESGNAVVTRVLAFHEEGPVDAATALRLDPDRYDVPLPWRPGVARVDFRTEGEWFHRVAAERGFPVAAGLSGTAARLAMRFRLPLDAGISQSAAAGAILAFVVPHHHSLYEAVQGMRMAGMHVVDDSAFRFEEGEVAELYRAVFESFGIPAPDGTQRPPGHVGSRPSQDRGGSSDINAARASAPAIDAEALGRVPADDATHLAADAYLAAQEMVSEGRLRPGTEVAFVGAVAEEVLTRSTDIRTDPGSTEPADRAAAALTAAVTGAVADVVARDGEGRVVVARTVAELIGGIEASGGDDERTERVADRAAAQILSGTADLGVSAEYHAIAGIVADGIADAVESARGRDDIAGVVAEAVRAQADSWDPEAAMTRAATDVVAEVIARAGGTDGVVIARIAAEIFARMPRLGADADRSALVRATALAVADVVSVGEVRDHGVHRADSLAGHSAGLDYRGVADALAEDRVRAGAGETVQRIAEVVLSRVAGVGTGADRAEVAALVAEAVQGIAGVDDAAVIDRVVSHTFAQMAGLPPHADDAIVRAVVDGIAAAGVGRGDTAGGVVPAVGPAPESGVRSGVEIPDAQAGRIAEDAYRAVAEAVGKGRVQIGAAADVLTAVGEVVVTRLEGLSIAADADDAAAAAAVTDAVVGGVAAAVARTGDRGRVVVARSRARHLDRGDGVVRDTGDDVGVAGRTAANILTRAADLGANAPYDAIAQVVTERIADAVVVAGEHDVAVRVAEAVGAQMDGPDTDAAIVSAVTDVVADVMVRVGTDEGTFVARMAAAIFGRVSLEDGYVEGSVSTGAVVDAVVDDVFVPVAGTGDLIGAPPSDRERDTVESAQNSGRIGSRPGAEVPLNRQQVVREAVEYRRPVEWNDILGDDQILLLGEDHSHTEVRELLAQQASALRSAGITHFGIEAPPHPAFEALNTGREVDLGTVRCGPGPDSSYQYAVAAMARAGIKIIPFDVPDFGTPHGDPLRDVRESHMTGVLTAAMRAEPGSRIAVLVGDLHINRNVDDWMQKTGARLPPMADRLTDTGFSTKSVSVRSSMTNEEGIKHETFVADLTGLRGLENQQGPLTDAVINLRTGAGDLITPVGGKPGTPPAARAVHSGQSVPARSVEPISRPMEPIRRVVHIGGPDYEQTREAIVDEVRSTMRDWRARDHAFSAAALTGSLLSVHPPGDSVEFHATPSGEAGRRHLRVSVTMPVLTEATSRMAQLWIEPILKAFAHRYGIEESPAGASIWFEFDETGPDFHPDLLTRMRQHTGSDLDDHGENRLVEPKDAPASGRSTVAEPVTVRLFGPSGRDIVLRPGESRTFGRAMLGRDTTLARTVSRENGVIGMDSEHRIWMNIHPDKSAVLRDGVPLEQGVQHYLEHGQMLLFGATAANAIGIESDQGHIGSRPSPESHTGDEGPGESGATPWTPARSHSAAEPQNPETAGAAESSMDQPDFSVISSEVAYSGRSFRMLNNQVRMPDGKALPRDVIDVPATVAVLALDRQGRVVLTSRFRPAVDDPVLELPSGVLTGDEDPLATARRALAEAGLIGGETWSLATDMVRAGGMSNAVTRVLVVREVDDIAGAQPQQNMLRIPIEEAIAHVAGARIVDSAAAVGVLAAAAETAGEVRLRPATDPPLSPLRAAQDNPPVDIAREFGAQPLQRHSEQTVYSSPVNEVRRVEFRTPDGNMVEQDIVTRHAAVMALPWDERTDEVVLVRQYRPALGRWVLQLPAGMLDKAGEDPLAGVRRELAEEAGIGAREWGELANEAPPPWITSEHRRIYLARDLHSVPRPDSEESDEIGMRQVRIPVAEALDMAMRNEIDNSAAVFGLLALTSVRAGRWEPRVVVEARQRTGTDDRPEEQPEGHSPAEQPRPTPWSPAPGSQFGATEPNPPQPTSGREPHDSIGHGGYADEAGSQSPSAATRSNLPRQAGQVT